MEPTVEKNCIHLGKNLGVLRRYPDHFFDSVVTDPPYGIGNKEPSVQDIARYLDGNTLDTGGDFMGHKWEIPPVSLWKEVFRVLKPGGYVACWASTRTWDLMSLGLRAAGFECRDTFAAQFGPSMLAHIHCLPEGVEVLTSTGWKDGAKVSKKDSVVTWNPEDETLSLEHPSQTYAYDYEGNLSVFRTEDVVVTCTPNHRVYHKKYIPRRKGYQATWHVEEASSVSRTTSIQLPTAGILADGVGIGGEDYASLLGWVWTEGAFDKAPSTGIQLYQSLTANPEKVETLDRLLLNLSVNHSRYVRERTHTHKGISRKYVEVCWFFTGEMADRVRSDLAGNHPSWSLLWNMTQSERLAFYEAAMAGGGHGNCFYQKSQADLEWFQALALALGYTTKVSMRPGRDNGSCSVRKKSATRVTPERMKLKSKPYKGLVWCLSVPTGAFVIRQEGRVSITGNSQGFPKSVNVSKQLEKKGASPEEVKKWEGYGTALKPSWEPILIFRKPLEGETLADNVLAHGVGVLAIDQSRVKHASPEDFESHKASVDAVKASAGKFRGSWKNSSDLSGANDVTYAGRWPPNVLLTHADGCEYVGTRKMDSPVINRFDDGMKPFGDGAGHSYTTVGDGAPEEVPVYQCVEGCPVRALDDQSGPITRVTTFPDRHGAMGYGAGASCAVNPLGGVSLAGEKGTGASRYFPSFSPLDAPFKYNAKVNKAESTLNGTLPNIHPTVKPLALAAWVVRLVTPKGGVVLDPYAGSGSIPCAAVMEGFDAVGIDQWEEVVVQTARPRLQHYLDERNNTQDEKDLFEMAFGRGVDPR